MARRIRRRRSRLRTVRRRRGRHSRIRRRLRKGLSRPSFVSTAGTVINALWGINNIAGAEISAAPDIGGKIMAAVNTVIRKTTGLDLQGGQSGQPTISIGGIFNAQTITGITMLAYGMIGRRFRLPMTSKASGFGRKAITFGAISGLFSGNSSTTTSFNQAQIPNPLVSTGAQ